MNLGTGATLGELIFVLSANLDKLHAELRKGEGAVQASGAKMGGMMKAAGLAMAGGIAAFGIAAAKAGMELESAMARVASLIPGNTQRVHELRQAMVSLSNETGKTSKDLADGLYQVISAFGDTKDSVALTAIAAKAATAGLSTTTEATNYLAAVTKAYGDTSKEAASKVSDLGFMTVNLGQTTFPELAASIGRVTPLAKTMGVSLEELHAVFATLTGVTGNTAEVSTQYAAILRAMLRPTDEMAEAINKLGYENGKAMIESLGFAGSLQALSKQAGGSETEIVKLFGRAEALTAVFALTGSQAETFAKKLDAMSKASGATNDAFGEIAKTTEFKLNKAMATLQNGLAKVGEALLPVIENVAALVEWLTKLKAFESLNLAIKVTMAGPRGAQEMGTAMGLDKEFQEAVAKAQREAEKSGRAMNYALFISDKVFDSWRKFNAGLKETIDGGKKIERQYETVKNVFEDFTLPQDLLDYLNVNTESYAERNAREYAEKWESELERSLQAWGQSKGRDVLMSTFASMWDAKGLEDLDDEYWDSTTNDMAESFGKMKDIADKELEDAAKAAYEAWEGSFTKDFLNDLELVAQLLRETFENDGVDAIAVFALSVGDLLDNYQGDWEKMWDKHWDNIAAMGLGTLGKMFGGVESMMGRMFSGAGAGLQLGSAFGPIGSIIGGIAGGLFGGLFGGDDSKDRERRQKEAEERQRKEIERLNKLLEAFQSTIADAIISGDDWSYAMQGMFNELTFSGYDLSDTLELVTEAIEDQEDAIRDAEEALEELPDSIRNMRIGLDDMRRSFADARAAVQDARRALRQLSAEDRKSLSFRPSDTNKFFGGDKAYTAILEAIAGAKGQGSKLGGYITLSEERDILGGVGNEQTKILIKQLIEAENAATARQEAIRNQIKQIGSAETLLATTQHNLPLMRERLADLVKFRADFGSLGFEKLHNDLVDIRDALNGLPRYASGTASVPKTGMALVHKGEIIMPQPDFGALTSGVANLKAAAIMSSPVPNMALPGGLPTAAGSASYRPVINIQIGGKEIKDFVVSTVEDRTQGNQTRISSSVIKRKRGY